MVSGKVTMTDGGTLNTYLSDVLRKARLNADVSATTAADVLGCSPTKVSRMEHDQVPIKPRDAFRLLRLYKWSAHAAARASGYDPTSDGDPLDILDFGVAPWALPYLQYERHATHIETCAYDTLPGLVQTQDYSAALGAGATHPAAQTARQDQFFLNPGRMFLVLAENALLCHTLDKPQLAAQLTRLLELADHPRVTLVIVPHHGWAQMRLTTSFTRFQMPPGSHQEQVVCLYGLRQVTYLPDKDEYARYGSMFDRLVAAALDVRESKAKLRRMGARLNAA